ncbi:MAG: hypothetical protein ACI9BW_000312 [Gammaproteobacteria bacterium]|jgi:hypothetical protein
MNLQDVGSIGELVGAVATVGTLVYLAIQVRRNTQALQASSVQNMLDGPRDRIVAPTIQNREVADIHARGLSSFEDLDETEQTRFTFLLIEHVVQFENVKNLHQRRLVTDENYATWLIYVGAFIRTPGGSVAWPQVANVVDKGAAKALETHLQENPDLPSLLQLMPVMDKRKNEGSA